jgi:hypothetical protein
MIKNTIANENINLFLSDDNNDTDDEELNKLIQKFYNDDEDDETDDMEDMNNCDLNLSILIDYSENNTIKQLIRISDYYEISKEFKLTKAKKIDIVNAILIFENDVSNKEIVMKRKRMWHYMNELKNDRHMKQFIFWS